MKIGPIDKLQAVVKPAPVNPKEKTEHGNFASILEQKVARPEGSSPRSVQSVSPLTPPSLPLMSRRPINEMTVTGLLDSLESYRQLLADPMATLRDLAPAVENMKKRSDDALKTFNGIAEDDLIKDVLQQSVLVIAKEIERFDLGVYVED